MKTLNIKRALSASILLLLLTATVAACASLPTTNAAVPYTQFKSFVYLGVSPSTVGVGQETIVVAWTADMPYDVGEQAGKITSPNGRAAWNNLMTVNIIKPDGTNETLELPRTDPVGATWAMYTPQTTGTYQLQVYFPGEWKNTTDASGTTVTASRYYTPDWSPVANLTVTEEPTPVWNEAPLTDDYWTRPINTADHNWYVLAGNWLGAPGTQYPQGSYGQTSNYAYGLGTETPHILWTKQYYAGGYGDEAYESTGLQTTHYQGISWTGIALNGQLHYTPRNTAHGTAGWEIVDLYTGDELSRNYTETRPSFGQVYNYESPNQHGAFSYLWRTSGVILPEIVQIPNATQFVNGSVVNLGQNNINSGYYYQVNRTSGKITGIGLSSGLSTLANPIATTTNFGSVWEMLDGYTEQTVCYIANVTQNEKRAGAPSAGVTTGATGTAVYGQDGSILRYNVVNLGSTASPQYFLQVWNTSAGTMVSSQLGTGLWQWRPAGGTFGGSPAYLGVLAYNYVHNGANFFSLNASIPSITGTPNNVSNQTASIQVVKEGEYIVLVAQGFNNGTSTVPGFILTLSLKPGEEGRQISRVEFTPPSTEGGTEAATRTGVYPEEGIIVFHKTKTLSRYGYSMDTGKLVWTSDPEVQFSYYGMSSNYYNGTLLSYGYGGVITCYDIKTGNVNWVYSADSIGTESAYGGTYPIGVAVIGDGKLYTVTGEHSPTQPLMRGPNLRCIDAATGEEIWKILGFFGGMSPTSSNIIMADNVLVGLNYFDMQLYAFGRGPSGVTVDAPNVAVLGHKVLVTGTVTDQSPAGERDTNDVMDTPLKGTPAISDADMQAWMEYLFMEQVKPTDAQGVTVTLNAIDPNGNYVAIGETTSDINGNWGCSFQPEVPGDYQIIATFAGSKAYGPSQSSTYLTVEDAPTATSEPTSPPQSVADMYFVPAIAILAILIVVVGGVLGFLLLRKHP